MPLEIRELVIKAAIGSGKEQNDTQQGGGGDESEEGKGNQAIIQACVEKVLEIINEKMER
ncbi:MAG: DUF5908 family protein [Saprospiraceae bacterium]|nr:hypothetical protein [Lewinella sp.]